MVKSRNPRLWLTEAYGWLDIARGLGLRSLYFGIPAVLLAAFAALSIIASGR